MTRRIWLMLLLLAVGLAGTATAADRPAWVDGESDEWPRSKFLTGVGSADERGVAESRARAELARVFQARVESEISSQEFESVRSSGADTQSRRGMDARDVTQVVTTGELVGTSIVATWTDPATRRIYALAVLDRRKALQAALGRIGELDAQLEQVIAGAPPATDRVGSALALIPVAALLRERAPLVAQVRVLEPGSLPAPSIDTAAVAQRAEKALLSLKVAIPAKLEPEIEGGVRKGLLALGFRKVLTTRTGADLEVTLVVEKPEPVRNPPWYQVRMLANGRMQEIGGKRVLAEFKCSAREASQVLSEARLRARKALGESIEKAIAGSLGKGPGGAATEEDE